VDRLNYLDDSPVFPKDRRLAAAWLKGGVEEEKAERRRIFEMSETNANGTEPPLTRWSPTPARGEFILCIIRAISMTSCFVHRRMRSKEPGLSRSGTRTGS
jgi:hypothetical protein